MRMKSLLGLLAIGGAVAYAQKRRGGELTVEGFKKTFRELFGSLGANKGATTMRTGGARGEEGMPSYGSSGSGTIQHSSPGTYGDDYSSSPNGTGRR